MCSEHVIEVNNIQKAFGTKKSGAFRFASRF